MKFEVDMLEEEKHTEEKIEALKTKIEFLEFLVKTRQVEDYEVDDIYECIYDLQEELAYEEEYLYSYHR